MDTRQQLQKLFTFDLWCTRQLTRFILKSAPFKGQESSSAFLSHIINSQRIWFFRIIQIEEAPVDRWREYNLKEIVKEAKSAHQMWIDLIGDHDLDLDTVITYRTSRGTTHRNTVLEISQHLIIHGQHHRAQISLLLRQSGILPPPTDFIHYLRR